MKFLVSGSTHPGEEEILIEIFKSISNKHSALRLVLAPRHPERSRQVAQAVKTAGLTPVPLSSGKSIETANEVLIIDGIGHLIRFYAAADIVFVGKSLTVGGGHNIIEPAFFRKPVVIGPLMQNFKDITRLFLEEKAVIQVQSHEELQSVIMRLLESPKERQGLGEKAGSVIQANHGATNRTLEIIGKILNV